MDIVPEVVSVERAMEMAIAHHRAGRLAEAEKIYRKVLQAEPANSDALHYAGVLAHQSGKHAEALEAIEWALVSAPGNAIYLNSKGQVLRALGQLIDAQNCYERALAISPNFPEVHNNLGNVFLEMGQLQRAAESYGNAVRLRPDYAEANAHLGSVLKSLGRVGEATEWFRKAVALRPDLSPAHSSLGNLLLDQGDLVGAAECFRRILELSPEDAQVHNHLGVILDKQGRRDDARGCFERAILLKPDLMEAHNNLGMTFAKSGQFQAATVCYAKAMELDPRNYAVHHNLGNILKEQCRFDEAITHYRQAVELNPEFVDAHNHLGSVYETVGRLDEAQASYRTALKLDPGNAGVYVNLGNLCKDLGQLNLAIESYRRAIQLQPDLVIAHGNLLLTLNHAFHISAAEVFREHLAFAERFEAPLRDAWRPHTNTRDKGRRLTVGYVVPGFRHDTVARYIEHVLAKHDQGSFRLLVYSDSPVRDELTERAKRYLEGLRETHGMDDQAVADLIRRDGVDLLVDLAGHSAGNRLLVFARKPAPVQLTWLGYPSTTGLKGMDYRLTDRMAEPFGNEHFYTEELVYLPDSVWCYPDSNPDVDVGGLPALARGYITFGSLNNFAKVGPEVLALWVKLIKSIPGSKLLVGSALESRARGELIANLADQGLEAERVELVGRLSHEEYLMLHNRIDIALDPFPCNGGATTCDALWMGVPVITLAGTRFVSRAGVSLLSAVGLGHWAARSESEYVELAQAWSANLSGLARLRKELRGKLRASPLMDSERFTRNLEAAYRQMWSNYCLRDVR